MNPHDRTPDPPHGSGDAAAIDALLAGHALGDLDSDERERLASLLQQDPGLRDRLDEFRTSLQLLPLALPATVKPPPRLRRRLLGEAQRSSPRAGVEKSVAGRRLVPAVLGLAVLVLGVQLHQTRQQLARIEQQFTSTQGVTPVSRHMDLVGVDPRLRANGEVMVTGNSTHNVLMLNDLPPPPPGHVYRLWAEVDGRTVGCVAFTPTAQGHVSMLIPPLPTSRARSLRVSIEPDPMGTAPTGPTVLRSLI